MSYHFPSDSDEPVTGTIFDADLDAQNGYLRQRRCGLFYLHDVNPGAVSVNEIAAFKNSEGEFFVSYYAIHMAEGETQWSVKPGMHMPIPVGVVCEGGEGHEWHRVTRLKSFKVSWDEIALTPESRREVTPRRSAEMVLKVDARKVREMVEQEIAKMRAEAGL